MEVKKLISALTNKEVAEALGGIIRPIIAQSLTCIDELKSVIEELRDDLKAKTETIITLRQENENLNTKLCEASNRIDLLETYTRVDNLIVKGIPDTFAEVITGTDSGPDPASSDSTLRQVLSLCANNLRIDVDESDISITHRLPKGKKDKYHPIIVRFTSRRIRDNVYRAKKNLRGQFKSADGGGVYINEHLTKAHDSIYSECRRLVKAKKIDTSWTWHGITYIKQLNGNIKRVASMNVLEQLNLL